MDIKISQHAQQRMSERGIKKSEILQTLEFPQKTNRRGAHTLMMRVRENNQLLIVVCKKKGQRFKVITAISTSKVNKYL
jgi:hypothetical protein